MSDGNPDPENIEVAKPFSAADEPFAGSDGTMIVPDVIGEVIGWRVWRVMHPYDAKLVRLQSLGAGGTTHAVPWTPGKTMQAFCARDHVIPAKSCSCGFYAARTQEHLLSMSYHRSRDFDDPNDVLVIGEVAMSGRIIPGTQGWRAQRVRPKTILVPYSRWKAAKTLKAAYPDVDVRLDNFYKAAPST